MDAEEIVRTYSDMIYRITLSYTKNKEDAEDAYGETFLRLFKKEREFNSEEHRKAWLIRVAINCSKQILMSRPGSEELNDEIEAAPEAGLSPEEHMDLKEAISRLSGDYQSVIELYYLQSLSVREISELLGRPENTVKSLLKRAREMLKGFLT